MAVLIDVHYARPEDAKKAAAIIRAAAEWLIARNQRQWSPELFTEAWAQKLIQRGELLTVRRDGEIIGMAQLDGEDKTYWADDKPGEALYLHKIAVTREAAGQGISKAVIEWAAQEAARKGCTFLRLNCWPTRPSLLKLYRANGFEEVYHRDAKDDRGMPCGTVGMQRRLTKKAE